MVPDGHTSENRAEDSGHQQVGWTEASGDASMEEERKTQWKKRLQMDAYDSKPEQRREGAPNGESEEERERTVEKKSEPEILKENQPWL